MTVALKSTLKHESLYQQLAEGIRRGDLKAGERLSGEEELAKQFGVSRGTVRRGLSLLEEQGMVVRRQGSGAFVTSRGSTQSVVSKSRKAVVVLSDGDGLIDCSASAHWRSQLREGLIRGALPHGIDVFDESSAGADSSRHASWFGGRLAGVIAFSTDDGVESLLADYPDDLPKVVLNRPAGHAEVPSVSVDHRQGTYESVSALLRIGHRRITIVSEAADSLPSRERVAGYRQAFEEAGLPVDESRIITHQSLEDRADWPGEVRRILQDENRPTALLLNNQGRAVHFLDIVHSVGLKVPSDLSLVLFDDDPLLLKTSPTIACVRQPIMEMGKLTMDLIVKLGEKAPLEKTTHVLLPEFVFRGSVGAPPSISEPSLS